MRRLVLLAALVLAGLPGAAHATHPLQICDAGIFAADIILTPGADNPGDRWEPPHCTFPVTATVHTGRLTWDATATGIVRVQTHINTFRDTVAFCRVRAGIALVCEARNQPPVFAVDHLDFTYGTVSGQTIEMSVGAEPTKVCHGLTVCVGTYYAFGIFRGVI